MKENMGIPEGYRPLLRTLEVQEAIKRIKDFFQQNLAESLNLSRVSAPLFVRAGSGVNDDLNGVERPVSFPVKDDGDARAEIVHSLAKWKRLALMRYGFAQGTGLYTDMNAIRPDETLDNLHSIYVDQWDWEAIIREDERDLETLKRTVNAIYKVIAKTEFHVASLYARIRPVLPESIVFVTAEELLRRFPGLDAKEREDRICREHGAVFVIGIGGELSDGSLHDGRAPDYDDWSTERSDGGYGLNGDILLWHPVLERAFEISSMGIRVSPEALEKQLVLRGKEDWRERSFHRLLLSGGLPQTIGGGIGQSRLCMFLLRTAHIGEVAVGLWPEAMQAACEQRGVELL